MKPAMEITEPQWTAGSRLLKLGEKIEFDFFLPAGVDGGSVSVFPRYLERARPGNAFVAGGDLMRHGRSQGSQYQIDNRRQRAAPIPYGCRGRGAKNLPRWDDNL